MMGLILRLVLLAGLSAALGLAGLAVWGAATRWSRPEMQVVSPSPQSGAPKEILLDMPLLSAFPETLKRPLFFEGRTYPTAKPPAPAPAAEASGVAKMQPQSPAGSVAPAKDVPVADTPVPPDGVSLLGVLIAQGRARAYIEAAPDTGDWLSVGAKVRDWTIEGITTDRVALRRGRQTATLHLYAPTATSARPTMR